MFHGYVSHNQMVPSNYFHHGLQEDNSPHSLRWFSNFMWLKQGHENQPWLEMVTIVTIPPMVTGDGANDMVANQHEIQSHINPI